MRIMPAVVTGSMIRREIGDDQICLLTFDRPDSSANIFDAATLNELNEHLDFVENERSLRGVIIALRRTIQTHVSVCRKRRLG